MSQTADDDEFREKLVRLVFTPEMRMEKLALVARFKGEGNSLYEACRLAEVSRAWVYKWRDRERPEESWEDRREMTQGDREWICTLLDEGMTQKKVAAEVQVSRSSVRKVERQRQARLKQDQLHQQTIAQNQKNREPLRLEPVPASESMHEEIPGREPQLQQETESIEQLRPIDPKAIKLIGPAGEMLKTFSLEHGPLKVLFHGPPGVGKTALCNHLASRLVAPEHIERIIGPNCTVDKLRELMITFLTRPLFSDWHVMILDEADKIPSVAQIAIHELFDRLPEYCAIFATTNESESKFTKRLWTRFERHPLAGPTKEEIAGLISEKVPKKKRDAIAAAVNGNARDALLEAKAWARFNLTGPEKSDGAPRSTEV